MILDQDQEYLFFGKGAIWFPASSKIETLITRTITDRTRQIQNNKLLKKTKNHLGLLRRPKAVTNELSILLVQLLREEEIALVNITQLYLKVSVTQQSSIHM